MRDMDSKSIVIPRMQPKCIRGFCCNVISWMPRGVLIEIPSPAHSLRYVLSSAMNNTLHYKLNIIPTQTIVE